MRSRYSAHVMRHRDYLIETWHADHRPAQLELAGVKWINLRILDFQPMPTQASVEFEASLLHRGRVDALHELSQFVFEQGRWLYTRGETLAPSFQPWKPGRNETCPCGSGKKFKRCCSGSGHSD